MAFVKITEIDILSPTCDVDVWKTYYFGDTKINDVLINDHVFASGIRGNAITEVDEGLKDICEVSGGKKCVSPSEEVDTGRDYVLPRYDVDWEGGVLSNGIDLMPILSKQLVTFIQVKGSSL